MTILGTDDGGITTLEGAISKLTDMYNSLSSQLGDYSDSTLEGQQSINALTDRMSLYQQAINQYQDLISKIKSSADEAKRGSVTKQQAKQGYITGMATKRGQTGAEALKDMADIEATGIAERSDIRSQEMQNLSSAKGGLSNLYMNVAEQQAAVDAANASRSGSYGTSGGLSSALSDYTNTGGDISQEVVEGIMGTPTDDTLAKAAQGGKEAMLGKKKNKSYLDMYKILGYLDPGPIGAYTKGKFVYDNIFKKLNK